MEEVKVTYMDLDAIVRLSGTDEGMHELLSKVKAYYLLKCPEPVEYKTSSMYGATAYSGNTRQLNTTYTAGLGKDVTFAVNAKAADRICIYTGGHLYATFDLTAGMSYSFTFMVLAGEDYWVEGEPSTTTIVQWVEH